MKLRLYSFLMQVCDFLCADLHRTERHIQHIRNWAWLRSTAENLRTCNDRTASRL